MYAAPMPPPEPRLLESQALDPSNPNTVFVAPIQASKSESTGLRPFDPSSTTRRGGHGISNWEIGRAAEAKGVKVKEFDRKDRWTAWRVRAKKVQEYRIAKAAKGNRKTKGKKSSKKVVL